MLAFGVAANAEDRVRDMQAAADQANYAEWGFWGTQPEVYRGSTSHSNRLIPIYTFGQKLTSYIGEKSVYRDADALKRIYGFLPDRTLNPQAEYCDQTDVYRWQQQAVAAGKKYIFLIVFDGMDWELTRAAAHYYQPEKIYHEGRGAGLGFLEYEAPESDFGFCVTSPTNSQAKFNIDTQQVENAAIGVAGGYDPSLGGETPWRKNPDLSYLLGRHKTLSHAVADSTCTAAAMTTGKKSYNGAMNVDSLGRQSTPLAVELQAKGWRVGVVTSVPVPHATPGCAYANNVYRTDYQDISRDLLGVKSSAHPNEPLPGMDVVIGAGWGNTKQSDSGQGQNYLAGNQYTHETTIAEINALNGGKYQVVERSAGVAGGKALLAAAREAAAKRLRLFGFFGTKDGHLPFATADGNFDPVMAPKAREDSAAGATKLFSAPTPYDEADLVENPTLAEMTRAALDVLAAEPRQPFWVMIEAGDVDWAAHNDNIDNVIGAVKSGDEAFRVVVDWIDKHQAWEDAAVIVTADHGHLFTPTKLEALRP